MRSWSSLDSRPLVAVDEALAAITSEPSSEEGVQHLCRAAFRHLEREPLWLNQRYEALVSADLNAREQAFIAGVLLRLLDAAPEWGRGATQIGRLAMRALDAGLTPNLYRRLGIKDNDQTYEKVQKLRGADQASRTALSTAIRSAATVNLDTTRTEVLRALQHEPRTVALFSSEPLCSPARVGSLFEYVSAYLSASPADAMRCYEECLEALAEYRAEAEQIGSAHATDGPAALAGSLRLVVEGHFAASPLSQPADLFVSPEEKKYPFGQTGATLNLALRVSNNGRGAATDVRLVLSQLNPEL